MAGQKTRRCSVNNVSISYSLRCRHLYGALKLNTASMSPAGLGSVFFMRNSLSLSQWASLSIGMCWLQVYSLPNLELLLSQKLMEALGFPWRWAGDNAQLSRLCAVGQDGQLALVCPPSLCMQSVRSHKLYDVLYAGKSC